MTAKITEEQRLGLEASSDQALAAFDLAADRQRAQARFLDPDDKERDRPPLGVDLTLETARKLADLCFEEARIAGLSVEPSKDAPPEGLPDDMVDSWRSVKAIAVSTASAP